MKVYDSISPTGLGEVPNLPTFHSDSRTAFYISGAHDGADKEYCLLALKPYSVVDTLILYVLLLLQVVPSFIL